VTTPPGVALPLGRRSGAVVLVACAALTAFYYFARADTIGVIGSGRTWTPMTGHPWPVTLHLAIAALLLGLLPALAARKLTGLSWAGLGLGPGRWRQGLLLLAAAAPFAILAGRIGAASPAMRAVYPLDPSFARGSFAAYAILQFFYFGAWEVLFRGVLLFATRGRFGDAGANALQTAVSVTAHFGRAVNETVAAFPAGLLFGWVGLRLESIWYVAVLHWLTGVSLDWFILFPP
jgi:membrane protease YdiL (CAAX protease family)